jgi:transcriptional regulator with XRE-family HTH domain
VTLAEKVNGLRGEKGFSLEDLEHRSGLDISTLSRYSSKPTNPRMVNLTVLARALDVRVGYLLGEIPELEDIGLREVAVREALRIYLAEKTWPARRKRRYWRAVDLPQAPRTLEGWRELDELMSRILGKKALD